MNRKNREKVEKMTEKERQKNLNKRSDRTKGINWPADCKGLRGQPSEDLRQNEEGECEEQRRSIS